MLEMGTSGLMSGAEKRDDVFGIGTRARPRLYNRVRESDARQTSGAEARVSVGLQRHGWKPCPSQNHYETSSNADQLAQKFRGKGSAVLPSGESVGEGRTAQFPPLIQFSNSPVERIRLTRACCRSYFVSCRARKRSLAWVRASPRSRRGAVPASTRVCKASRLDSATSYSSCATS